MALIITLFLGSFLTFNRNLFSWLVCLLLWFCRPIFHCYHPSSGVIYLWNYWCVCLVVQRVQRSQGSEEDICGLRQHAGGMSAHAQSYVVVIFGAVVWICSLVEVSPIISHANKKTDLVSFLMRKVLPVSVLERDTPHLLAHSLRDTQDEDVIS